MKADDVKRLKELEAESTRLKRLVADQVLENQALKEIAKETGEPVRVDAGRPACCRTVSASQSGGRADMSVSPARRSDASRFSRRMMRRCGQLRAFSRKRPRWGYRQTHQQLLDDG